MNNTLPPGRVRGQHCGHGDNPFEDHCRDHGFEWQMMTDKYTNATILKRPEFFTGTGGPVPIKQPAVVTHCAGEVYSRENFTAETQLAFATGLFLSFNITLSDTLVGLAWNSSHVHKDSFITYVGVQQNIPYQTSAAVLSVNANYMPTET